MNLAYGASAGAVTGIGILVSSLFEGPSQDGFDDAKLRQPQTESYAVSSPPYAANVYHLHLRDPFIGAPGIRSARFWTPIVSLSW